MADPGRGGGGGGGGGTSEYMVSPPMAARGMGESCKLYCQGVEAP